MYYIFLNSKIKQINFCNLISNFKLKLNILKKDEGKNGKLHTQSKNLRIFVWNNKIKSTRKIN